MKGKIGKDYRVVPRKGFEKIAGLLKHYTAIFGGVALICAFYLFLMLIDDVWLHETTFICQRGEIRLVNLRRGPDYYVLDIYSTDGERFTTKRTEIGYLLVIGREYHATSTLSGQLYGLVDDAGHVFINADTMRLKRNRQMAAAGAALSVSALVIAVERFVNQKIPLTDEEKLQAQRKYFE